MKWHAVHYKTGETVAIHVTDAEARVMPAESNFGGDNTTLVLTPGLIDLQINGFVGVDFNRPDQLADGDIAKVIEAQRALGITHILPTVTTNSFEHINLALKTLAEAMADPTIGSSMPAIHLEGPYFSPEDGPRGAHPKQHVRVPDWDEFQKWQETARGAIRLVTLSPHTPEAIDFIKRLVQNGIAASIGHTHASTDQIRAAIDAGASLSTHLGNGSHALIPRHPNYIWDQMAADELTATLVVDGHHLPPAVVKSMIRAKTPDRAILISDAVSVAGLKPGRYSTLGTDVELTEDGAVRLAGTPYLAGAALELPQAIVNTCKFAGVEFDVAVDMASLHAAQFLSQHASTHVDLGVHVTGDYSPDGSTGGSFSLYEKTDDRLKTVLTVVDGDVVYRA